MARALGYRPGGILSLAALIEQYPQAVERDLIDRGLRLRQLGTEALTWCDFRAIFAYPHPDMAVTRAMRPDEWQWGLTEQLLASAVDALTLLVWAKTKDAQKGRNRPKPIPRPGIARPERIGDAMSIEELNALIGWEV
ncbi:DUF5361 domain-containing protein [Nocardia sp. CA-290969]|uniref:DUF5361 domain-containing protein n=1 Tax=Nocardia sp. CA-290969 TaxID=3239986 RepID=UPI003D909AFC